jgi:hypothetical protein
VRLAIRRGMRRLVCALLVLAMLSTVASADDGKKDETTAVVISVGAGLLLPVALIGASESTHGAGGLFALTGLSIILGPTAGHWYAGRAWTNATTVRLLASLTFAYGAVIAITSDCEDETTNSCESDANTAADVALVSLGVIAGSAIYDIATAGRSAREYNARHFSVAPVVMPGPPGGQTTVGIGIGGSF